MRYRVTSTVEIDLTDDTPQIAGASWRRRKDWEPQGVDVLRIFLDAVHRRGAKTVVDVGANAGTWSLALAELPTVRCVVAYEPVPELHELLGRNVALSRNAAKIVTRRLAASDANEAVRFLVASNAAYSHMGARLLRTHGKERLTTREIEVRAFKLDDDDALRAGVDAIKVDVEGAEVRVLRGAFGLIQRFRPLVLFESVAVNARQHDIDPRASVALMRALGYKVRMVAHGDALATPD